MEGALSSRTRLSLGYLYNIFVKCNQQLKNPAREVRVLDLDL